MLAAHADASITERRMSRLNLADNFNRFFTIAPAVRQEEKDHVFFIRHDVYARELGYEPVRPDQKETDAYDPRSIYCLMQTAEANKRLVGCARVVLTDPAAPDSLLPFEKACKDSLYRDQIDPAKLPRDRVAEVSRLAVLSDFRRRRGEEHREVAIDVSDFGDSQQPRFPYIPVGLYMASVLMAQRHNIEYLFTLTEPRLAEHFAKLGVEIVPIGAPIEHRGMRVPSLIRAATVESGLRLMIRPLWKAIEAQMGATDTGPAL
ncbi:PEP-CTERM/exosortase system-associated acyltransferase [Pseudorhodoferax sp.]|uniref:PEP-CTERM/exosortase system-associated acyltransferase n=1 Tax=Pseudorhodoferax sp. TaxID=1993553 RepID=UPI002DD655DC|nr:PEP-CTERM/exosortase system-associated acyltransferase [Pseudorhodoferax sp.]